MTAMIFDPTSADMAALWHKATLGAHEVELGFVRLDTPGFIQHTAECAPFEAFMGALAAFNSGESDEQPQLAEGVYERALAWAVRCTSGVRGVTLPDGSALEWSSLNDVTRSRLLSMLTEWGFYGYLADIRSAQGFSAAAQKKSAAGGTLATPPAAADSAPEATPAPQTESASSTAANVAGSIAPASTAS